jgi:hypothetical protein
MVKENPFEREDWKKFTSVVKREDFTEALEKETKDLFPSQIGLSSKQRLKKTKADIETLKKHRQRVIKMSEGETCGITLEALSLAKTIIDGQITAFRLDLRLINHTIDVHEYMPLRTVCFEEYPERMQSLAELIKTVIVNSKCIPQKMRSLYDMLYTQEYAEFLDAYIKCDELMEDLYDNALKSQQEAI